MKTYTKPKMVALSLAGNSLLCACEFDVSEPNMSEEIRRWLGNLGWLNSDKTGAQTGVFTEDMNSCMRQLPGYCKMGPSGEIIFNS